MKIIGLYKTFEYYLSLWNNNRVYIKSLKNAVIHLLNIDPILLELINNWQFITKISTSFPYHLDKKILFVSANVYEIQYCMADKYIKWINRYFGKKLIDKIIFNVQ